MSLEIILNNLEVINISDHYGYYYYKGYGIGKFSGWIPDRDVNWYNSKSYEDLCNKIEELVKDHNDHYILLGDKAVSINIVLIKNNSNRLIGRFCCAPYNLEDGKYVLDESKKFIASSTTGRVQEYSIGGILDITLQNGETEYITNESSKEQKEACIERTLLRLINFIDNLEVNQNVMATNS
jgi:hypothetical protein